MRRPGVTDISVPFFNIIIIIIIIITDSISGVQAVHHETAGDYNFRVPQAHFLYN